METALIFWAVEILSSEGQNFAVIPPQKSSYYYVEKVCTHHHSPVRSIVGIEGCDGLQKCWPSSESLGISACDIDRNENSTTKHSDAQKNVPTHSSKTQENSRIKPYQRNEFLFLRLHQRHEPCKYSFSHRWWRMLIICMLEFRSVDDGIIWSKKGKYDCYEDSKADRCGERSPNGTLLKLKWSVFRNHLGTVHILGH